MLLRWRSALVQHEPLRTRPQQRAADREWPAKKKQKAELKEEVEMERMGVGAFADAASSGEDPWPKQHLDVPLPLQAARSIVHSVSSVSQ